MELGLFFALIVIALEWHRFQLKKQQEALEKRISHFEILLAENHDNLCSQTAKINSLSDLENSFPEVREVMVRVEGKLDQALKEHEAVISHKFGRVDFVEGL